MRGFCFINGVKKNIKCAYVGINGKAQYIMKPPVICYGGAVEELGVCRRDLAATTVGNYALFGGGARDSGNVSTKFSSTVDVYNSSLIRTTATDLSEAKTQLAATTVGNYALFGGGYIGADTTKYYTSTVDVYDTSLTKTTATDLSSRRYDLAATTVGNYALFSSGTSYTVIIDAYDTSLTRTAITDTSLGRRNPAATTVGDYALFGGGYSRSICSTVDAYNSSLTKTTAPDLSNINRYFAATTVGNYALFGGGADDTFSADSTYYSTVDVYNSSLTKTTATSLSVGRCYLAATTVGNYAVFGGGADNMNFYPTVDAYNSSLTKTTATDLSVARAMLTATTVGNYALFGGGYDYYRGYSSTVDAFTFNGGLIHDSPWDNTGGHEELD